MSDPASQKNSPYIVLVLLSVLVVATLVVASMYFVGPNIKTYSEDSVTKEAVAKPATKEANKAKVSDKVNQIAMPNNTLPKKEVIKVVSNDTPKKESNLLAAKIEPPVKKDIETKKTVKAESKPKDDCNIQFTGNQLLVKNTK